MSRLIAITLIILLIIGGFLFLKNRDKIFVKSIQNTASSSASLPDSLIWKDYVRQVISKRADITITSGNLYVQLTPIEENAWHIIIKPSKTESTDTTIVSKKMGLNINQPNSGNAAPLPDNFTVDTTLTTTQLEALINSLPQ